MSRHTIIIKTDKEGNITDLLPDITLGVEGLSYPSSTPLNSIARAFDAYATTKIHNHWDWSTTKMNTKTAPKSVEKTIQRTTQAQHFKLCSWLQTVFPTLRAGITNEEVAAMANESLKFDTITAINRYHIRGALETLELKLPTESLVGEDLIQDQLRTLTEAVISLFKGSGYDGLPGKLTDLGIHFGILTGDASKSLDSHGE